MQKIISFAAIMEGKITFLGTGTSQGVPMIACSCRSCCSADPRDKRLRTSALVEFGGKKIVIDAGPDFRQQILRVRAWDTDAVILTHNHKDHTGGLDDVRSFNYFQRRAFPIYSEPYVQESLKGEYPYVFAELRYPGAPEFELHTIGPEKSFSIDSAEIIPVRAWHYKLPVLGFRFGRLGYLTDANRIEESELEKFKGIDIFVISTIRRAEHISHFSLEQALEVARRTGAKRTFLTHISHQLEPYAELCEALPEGVEPAYDGLVIDF